MIVYIPTPITSAEQAESLPVGTVALNTSALPQDMTALVLGDDGIDGPGWQDEHEIKEHEYVVGWTALVPIEAEEETITVQTRGQAHPDWRTRLTTPWKWIDGPSPDRRGDCA